MTRGRIGVSVRMNMDELVERLLLTSVRFEPSNVTVQSPLDTPIEAS